ncbi:hypothetical protein ACHWQZ_G002332 [Mnemiopsis leidyi]
MVQSTLVTPEPYHLPGYLGYVPQFKFKIGGTYGQTTHSILYTPEQLNSRIPYRVVQEAKFTEPLARSKPAQEEGWNNTKLKGSMVPGYTGYVPKGQHFFGQRYAQACDNALKSFEADLVVKEKDDEILRRVPRRPLTPVSKANAYPLKPRDFAYGTSPYRLPNEHNEKYFVSGYTGFVPQARQLLAKSYPAVTHEALSIHQDVQDRVRGRRQETPAKLTRAKTAPPGVIYTRQSGLIPNYTGHVPAMKFKYGRTYGATTVNALNQSI